LVNHKADQADPLPDGFCRSEQPRGFVVITGVSDQTGEAFEDVGNARLRFGFGGTRQRSDCSDDASCNACSTPEFPGSRRPRRAGCRSRFRPARSAGHGREERASIALASNLPFGEWGSVFPTRDWSPRSSTAHVQRSYPRNRHPVLSPAHQQGPDIRPQDETRINGHMKQRRAPN